MGVGMALCILSCAWQYWDLLSNDLRLLHLFFSLLDRLLLGLQLDSAKWVDWSLFLQAIFVILEFLFPYYGCCWVRNFDFFCCSNKNGRKQKSGEVIRTLKLLLSAEGDGSFWSSFFFPFFSVCVIWYLRSKAVLVRGFARLGGWLIGE